MESILLTTEQVPSFVVAPTPSALDNKRDFDDDLNDMFKYSLPSITEERSSELVQLDDDNGKEEEKQQQQQQRKRSQSFLIKIPWIKQIKSHFERKKTEKTSHDTKKSNTVRPRPHSVAF